MLKIENLTVTQGAVPILKGVTLGVASGSTVALLGPNGSGKSTLAQTLMGNPLYTITAGHVTFNNHDLLSLTPEERARQGLFLAFQYPPSLAGVTLGHFLRLAYNSIHTPALSVRDFLTLLHANLDLLKLKPDFIHRSVNEGFSGGEKKRVEMLQLAVLKPRLAILDETDSGLDIDALKVMGEAIAMLRTREPAMSWLVITHYPHILDHLEVHRVAIMQGGKIHREGGPDVITQVATHGYAALV